MFASIVQSLKRAVGLAASPLAVYVDVSDSFTVRYELFYRCISQISVSPRNPKSDRVYFLAGFEPDTKRISKLVGISDRERPANEQKRLDEFLSLAADCVKELRQAGVPADVPMARRGINETIFTKGQEFVTQERIRVSVHVGYVAPCSDSGPGHLPMGVRVRVASDNLDYSRSTHCAVLEPYYSALEKSLLPKSALDDEFKRERYAGCSVSIDNSVLRYMCTPVEPGSPGHSGKQPDSSAQGA